MANRVCSAIHIDGLGYTYPDGHLALQGISLCISAGEKVALVGPNGAGKSTLLLHLNGILASQHGRVVVGGVPVVAQNLRQIRAMVGVVFQNPDDQLFSPTVFDDVAYGPIYMGLPPDEVHQRVARALDQVDMEAYSGRTSHHLSLGEKKRISIATVLGMDPSVLVLDEPSAGLDPRARRTLIHLLQQLGQTMLVSTHDLRLVKELCSRMVVLDQGMIVADGPTEALLQDDKLLYAHGLEPLAASS